MPTPIESRITSVPSGFQVSRGKTYTIELGFDGAGTGITPTVSQRAVLYQLLHLGFRSPTITVLDGDDPANAQHFLILAAFDPAPETGQPSNVSLRDVTIETSRGTSRLVWMKVKEETVR